MASPQDAIDKLEKMLPDMIKSQKEAHHQMRRSMAFCEYVKKWHPAVFESALKHINSEQAEDKPHNYCEIGMTSCAWCGWKGGKYPVAYCPECNHSFTD